MADDFWVVDWEMIGALAGVLAFIGGFGTAIVGYLNLVRRISHLTFLQEKAQNAIQSLDRVRAMSSEGRHGIWSQPLDLSPYWSDIDQRTPTLMLAHLKGGVGKTTIAANLAAAYATQGKRVLAIDLDYQGSLSSLFLGHAGVEDARLLEEANARAGNLLDEKRDAEYLLSVAREVSSDLPTLRYISASYSLADAENRQTLRWLIGDTAGGPDPRLYLARLLWSARVRAAFDLIVIDTAPRLTFGFVNGLCAASHVLTPTIMDGMSAGSVNDLFQQLRFLKRRLALPFDVVGVVPNRTHSQEKLTSRERPAAALIQRNAEQILGRTDILFDDALVRRNVDIQDAAGNKLAYFAAPETRPMFDRLAAKLAPRIGLI